MQDPVTIGAQFARALAAKDFDRERVGYQRRPVICVMPLVTRRPAPIHRSPANDCSPTAPSSASDCASGEPGGAV
jgi:hypothetical protein